MAQNEHKKPIPLNLLQEEAEAEDEGKGGTTGGDGKGGSSGEIEFRYRDVMSGTRDDLLPPSEIKRLVTVHREVHKSRVQKQKIDREQRAALKDGVYVAPTAEQMRKGLGGNGGSSNYKKHPISEKAQFSGIDKQVIGIAALNEADTNDKLKDDLENRLENQNRLQNQPKFNPRPSFRG